MIPEIDLDQLDADLYRAWQHLQKGNYAHAESYVAICWRHVREFRLSMDEEQPMVKDTGPEVTVRYTVYIGLVPALKRALYRLLNHRVNCGYNCEWVHPYGWVPEAGCPEHDHD